MKSIIKKILTNIIAISLVTYIAPGLSYDHNFKILITAAIVLSLVNIFIRPFLKILLLPLNIITLGLLGWFINVFILYITTLTVSGFTVQGFNLTLYSTTFILSTPLAFIFISFALNLTLSLVNWALD